MKVVQLLQMIKERHVLKLPRIGFLLAQSKKTKIDCKDEFGQHESIFDFDNCATYGKDVAINVKQ